MLSLLTVLGFAVLGGMLVLSRNRDECIIIGDHILITIVDIRGDKVRIGVAAAEEIPIHRKEVYKSILEERGVSRLMSVEELLSLLSTKLNPHKGVGLVLSRHRAESIMIGDDIVMTVMDIRGDRVRLGIEAPIEISVHRQEVYEAIQRQNRQAGRIEPRDARQIEGPQQKPPSSAGSTSSY